MRVCASGGGGSGKRNESYSGMNLTVHTNKTKDHLSTTAAPREREPLPTPIPLATSPPGPEKGRLRLSQNIALRGMFHLLPANPEDIFQFMTCLCPHDTFQIYHIRFSFSTLPGASRRPLYSSIFRFQLAGGSFRGSALPFSTGNYEFYFSFWSFAKPSRASSLDIKNPAIIFTIFISGIAFFFLLHNILDISYVHRFHPLSIIFHSIWIKMQVWADKQVGRAC